MKNIHLMGIGGSGMSGIAFLSSKMGYNVTGCDLEESTAYSDKFFHGHSPDHLKNIDLLVVTPAVYFQKFKDPELVVGEKRRISITWQEFLGKYLHNGKKVICVVGTHGKSTTTAMAGKLLTDAGLDPLVNLGANYKEWQGGARFGRGKYFVTEADEFYDNFLNYHPEIIILNNVEFDHPDYFKSEKQIFDSYKKFIGNLVGEKVLIVNADSPGVQKLLGEIDTSGLKIIKYSLKDKNLDLHLKIMGKHNLANALGVIALGRYLKINEGVITKSLEEFPGVGRRMELISERNGIGVYDDYAHHPTAIKATVDSLRENYKDKRIWAIYEAHSYSRTKALLPNYNGVFDSADKVIIGPIFEARDTEHFGISENSIAKASNHKDTICFGDAGKMFLYLNEYLKPGDVVLVMGAGKSYLWARKIAKIIEPKFSEMTSFRIGGKIKKYFEVKTRKEIDMATKYAKDNNLPIFVLGDGTDILVSDKEFNGVVIKFTGSGRTLEEALNEVKDVKITAQAGMKWDDLVEYAAKYEYQGIECMSGIPGTVGASPVQNIGAYGQEVKDTLFNVRAYEFETGKFKDFSNADCKFGYRESFFRKPENWQKYLITSVTFKLNRNKHPVVKYESLLNILNKQNIKKPSLEQIRNAVLTLRQEKLEDPNEVGNAGSFFKNPIVEAEIPGIPSFPFGNKFKLYAGWLIEKAGWKGKTYKGAAVSSKNSLILINKSGKAGYSDIAGLSRMIIQDVEKKFGVKLEPEVQFIGSGKKIAILGYGLEGQDAEKYFKDLGDEVTILDRKYDKSYLKNLNDYDIIVRSPGVYRYLSEIVKAGKSRS